MNEYQFTIKTSRIGLGCVYAKNEEEAKEKIKNDDYDDIVDSWSSGEDSELLTIELTESNVDEEE